MLCHTRQRISPQNMHPDITNGWLNGAFSLTVDRAALHVTVFAVPAISIPMASNICCVRSLNSSASRPVSCVRAAFPARPWRPGGAAVRSMRGCHGDHGACNLLYTATRTQGHPRQRRLVHLRASQTSVIAAVPCTRLRCTLVLK